MRKLTVDLHLDHLRVDHDEAELIRTELVEDTGNDRVDTNRLTRSGSTRYETVRHGGEVSDDSISVNVFSKSKWDLALRAAETIVLKKFAERNRDFIVIRDLDTDGVFSWDWSEDIDALCLGGTSQVSFKLGNTADTETKAWVDFVTGDRRTTGNISGGDFNPEGLTGIDDDLLSREKLFAEIFRRFVALLKLEEVESGELVVLEAISSKTRVLILFALEGTRSHILERIFSNGRVNNLRLGCLTERQGNLTIVLDLLLNRKNFVRLSLCFCCFLLRRQVGGGKRIFDRRDASSPLPCSRCVNVFRATGARRLPGRPPSSDGIDAISSKRERMQAREKNQADGIDPEKKNGGTH